jgi:hypothetical protein
MVEDVDAIGCYRIVILPDRNDLKTEIQNSIRGFSDDDCHRVDLSALGQGHGIVEILPILLLDDIAEVYSGTDRPLQKRAKGGSGCMVAEVDNEAGVRQ